MKRASGGARWREQSWLVRQIYELLRSPLYHAESWNDSDKSQGHSRQDWSVRDTYTKSVRASQAPRALGARIRVSPSPSVSILWPLVLRSPPGASHMPYCHQCPSENPYCPARSKPSVSRATARFTRS